MKFIKRWLSAHYPLIACQFWGHEATGWQHAVRWVEDHTSIGSNGALFGNYMVSTWYRIEGQCPRCGLVQPINELDHLKVKVSRDGVQVETTPVVTPRVLDNFERAKDAALGVWGTTTNDLGMDGSFETNAKGWEPLDP